MAAKKQRVRKEPFIMTPTTLERDWEKSREARRALRDLSPPELHTRRRQAVRTFVHVMNLMSGPMKQAMQHSMTKQAPLLGSDLDSLEALLSRASTVLRDARAAHETIELAPYATAQLGG
jgi:hypothetical protein